MGSYVSFTVSLLFFAPSKCYLCAHLALSCISGPIFDWLLDFWTVFLKRWVPSFPIISIPLNKGSHVSFIVSFVFFAPSKPYLCVQLAFFQTSRPIFDWYPDCWSLSFLLLLLPLLPPLPLSLTMSSTPPTSPQRHQAAGRQAERDSRVMGSPDQRKIPAAPSTSVVPPPVPPSAQTPTTIDGHTYHHLPPALAAMAAALHTTPVVSQCHGCACTPAAFAVVPSPVSFILFI